MCHVPMQYFADILAHLLAERFALEASGLRGVGFLCKESTGYGSVSVVCQPNLSQELTAPLRLVACDMDC